LPDYHAESCQLNNLNNIKQDWIQLQERANCSYFQSWGWIGTWLEQIAYDLEPMLVKIWHDKLLVGIGVFVSKKVTRHHIFHSNALFLNEYPFDGQNMVIEYNGLLADKDHQQAVYRETIGHIFNNFRNSDELFLSGLNENKDYKLLQENYPDNITNLRIVEKSPAWSVDLTSFGHGIDNFLKTLSKNRRSQIRRSIKAYEEQGPLKIKEADNKQEALIFFNGLKELHTERWKLKGGHGSFANPLWEQFHSTLISSRFTEGEIQLLQVSNLDGTIGYLYNFIWRKRVYVLQTGFKITDKKHLMPGYVVHVLAIAHNKQKGLEIYDLMHGDSLYKRILCNQSESLYWAVIQRYHLKFVLEQFATNMVRSFRKLTRSKQ